MLPHLALYNQLLTTRDGWVARHDVYAESKSSVDGVGIAVRVIRDLDALIEECRPHERLTPVSAVGVVSSEPRRLALGAGERFGAVRTVGYDVVADVQTASVVLRANGGHMAESHPEVKVVKKWHETSKGHSCSIEVAGKRARIFQRSKGSPFTLRQEGTDKNKPIWKSLYTNDKNEAWKVACAELTKPPEPGKPTRGEADIGGVPGRATFMQVAIPALQSRGGPLRLGQLVDAYWESGDFVANEQNTKNSKTSSARILLGYFGHDRLVEDITPDQCKKYETARGKGGIEYTDYDATPVGRQLRVQKKTPPAKPRTSQADLKFLRTMITWAINNWKSAGLARLDTNPMDNFKMPKELNPTRRVMPHDRFLTMLAGAQQLAACDDRSDDDRLRMRMLALALQVAEVFGGRIGAIRHLTLDDFDFDAGNGFADASVTWRAEWDKKGRERTTRVPRMLAQEVWQYCRSMPLPPSGWLFWKLTTDEALTTDVLTDLLHEAERAAGLTPLKYMGWHSIRRKWATERKWLPVKDAMAIGGWRDTKTFLEYQQADASTSRSILEDAPKLYSDGWLRSPDGSKVGDERAIPPKKM
jgi:integrase